MIRLAALALALAASVALAHSEKEIVLPAENAVVEGSPEAIGMTFDGAMRITAITLKGPDGAPRALARTDRMAPVLEFRATPEPLAPGAYRVDWKGISTDGHMMEGGWSFTVK